MMTMTGRSMVLGSGPIGRYRLEASDMTTLRKALIRLAHLKPELRPVLLPLLQKRSAESASAAYTKAHKDVVALLKKLDGLVAADEKEFKKSNGKDWGYVGDMNKIHSDLKELITFMTGVDH